MKCGSEASQTYTTFIELQHFLFPRPGPSLSSAETEAVAAAVAAAVAEVAAVEVVLALEELADKKWYRSSRNISSLCSNSGSSISGEVAEEITLCFWRNEPALSSH